MTAENTFIKCPKSPGKMCQISTCVTNPRAPDCIQFERGKEGKPKITTPQPISYPGKSLRQAVNQIYQAAGRQN